MTDFCQVRGALISKKNKISVITNQSRPKCIQSVKSLHAAAARCARTEASAAHASRYQVDLHDYSSNCRNCAMCLQLSFSAAMIECTVA